MWCTVKLQWKGFLKHKSGNQDGYLVKVIQPQSTYCITNGWSRTEWDDVLTHLVSYNDFNIYSLQILHLWNFLLSISEVWWAIGNKIVESKLEAKRKLMCHCMVWSHHSLCIFRKWNIVELFLSFDCHE